MSQRQAARLQPAAPADARVERPAGFERVLRACEGAAAVVGGFLMLLAMVLTTLDTMLRYIVGSPLSFNFYLTENYLMVGLIVLPLAWGFRAGGYIRILAFAALLPAAARELLLRAGLLVSAIYIGVLAWLSGVHFAAAYQRGDVQMGVIDWPVAWSWVCIPIGLGLLALRLLVTTFGPATELNQMHDDTVEEPV